MLNVQSTTIMREYMRRNTQSMGKAKGWAFVGVCRERKELVPARFHKSSIQQTHTQSQPEPEPEPLVHTHRHF